MQSVNIRLATLNDISRINELFIQMIKYVNEQNKKSGKEVNEELFKDGYEDGFLEKYLASSDKFILVAEIDSNVVGYLSCEEKNNDENLFIYLDDFCVDSKFRGYGIGTRLVEYYDYSLKFYGKERYLKSIKKEYFFEKNINNHNRLFIINTPFTSIDDYYDCICKIVKRFYVINKRKTMVISSAPYIYLPNIELSDLVKLKEKLFDSSILVIKW